MDTRASIEAMIDKLYAARLANDAAAAAAYFAEDGRFAANGTPRAAETHADRAGAMKDLFEGFALLNRVEHCRIIDGARAAVHWRGTFRTRSGKTGDADILDLIEFRDGKVAALTSFFDTAYAAALAG